MNRNPLFGSWITWYVLLMVLVAMVVVDALGFWHLSSWPFWTVWAVFATMGVWLPTVPRNSDRDDT